MKLTMLALFNNYLGAYDAPTFTNTPEDDIKETYRRSVLSQPDNAYNAHVADKSVCILGTFDDVTGEITLLDHPQKILDLATCFPPGYLAKRNN